MNSRFNSELLQVARQFRQLSQKDLAEKIQLNPAVISRIENGLVSPSKNLIDKLSSALNFPTNFFYFSDKIHGLPISFHPMWRKKSTVLQRDVDRVNAELNLRILHIYKLLKSVEHVPDLKLPTYDVEEFDGNIEEIAQLVRRGWGIPAGPLTNLTSYVERAGCFVVHTDLSFASIDGVTLSVQGMSPCIFLNKSQPADRLRFTLAHELGHLVMHKIPTLEMEKEASTFASALLMPAKDIRPYFDDSKLNLKRLAALKPEWKVAMQALLYRASDLGYVSGNQKIYLWQQFNIHRMKFREPPELDIEMEKPVVMPKLIKAHIESLGYSLSELKEMLGMYEDELKEFYDIDFENNRKPERPKLRIVSRN